MSKFPFLLKTAYRDSRRNRGRLILFMSSIILGITALVAINSFNYNLIRDIDAQAKTLLGADLMISGNKVLPDSLSSKLDTIPGERASEMELFSMAFIPKNEETQFVRIKALEGNFPFYGKILTDPVTASESFQSNQSALVDDALMFEHQLEAGDSIKLGEKTFKIEGRLMSTLGSVAIGSSFAPSIYISQSHLEETNLIQPGSMVNYSFTFKIPGDFNVESWRKKHRDSFRNESFNIQTIEEQKENLSEAFGRLNSFLNIVALVSLLLGCIGVASSVLIYIKTKIPSIAVFRCLGLTGSQAFLIFFIQITVLGILGVIIGCIFGSAIQILLPLILKDFLPYAIDLSISWQAIWQGLLIGSIVTTLFALIPLLSVRLISPLRTLRASFEEDLKPKDWLKTMIYIAIVLVIIAFLWSLTGDFLLALQFTGGLLISFLLLYGIGGFIMWFVKKSFPRHWNFVFRQGISNLFRPNNQTKTLIVSIGLGTSILTMLFIIQGLLLNNVASMDAGDQPNMILYGIENSQKEDLAEMTRSFDLPIIQQVPIVTMRLAGWKGKTKAEWMADTTRSASRWAINREARVSYRDSLVSDENLVRGSFTGSINPGDSIFISLDQRYASSMDVDLGDELVWNVQGTMLTTYVGSIRDIQFRSMRTRFFILFPEGVLENAPQFQVLVTKSPNSEVMGQYRREVVKAFPNVSVVDLGSILSTLNDILNKISYIIKFLAAFSILTGLIVLLSSLLLSKFQRIKESVILRTIGASKAQILKISATEYAILGTLSAATGILLALASSFLLSKFELEMDFDIQWWPLILIFIFIVSLTIFIGILNSQEVVKKSPLEVLRKEIE